jgi:hypothetical protein
VGLYGFVPLGCLEDYNSCVGTNPELMLVKTTLNCYKNPAMLLGIGHKLVVWNLMATKRMDVTNPLCLHLAPILDLFSQFPLKTLIQQ